MNSKYDEMYMTDEDLIRSRGIDASIANGAMSVAEGHGLKEEIRKKYGYSGGTDGSQYIKLDTKKNGFDSSALLAALANGENKWQKSLESAAKGYTGMSYDAFTKGDDYASLAKRYSTEGQKAMNATLAEIAARTGGMASSYATTAAGQVYNDYMTRLEDTARAMYEGERADAAEDLSVLRSMHDTEDSRKQTLASLAYQIGQDQKEDARYALEQAYNAASIGDFSQLDALGVDTSNLRSTFASEKVYSEGFKDALQNAKAAILGAKDDVERTAIANQLYLELLDSDLENWEIAEILYELGIDTEAE